jgi:hypothetical protein
MRTLFKAIVYKVGGGQCNKDTSSPISLESVILPGSHNKIKVTQNIFMNNFCFYCFLVFLIFTEIYPVCNLFWITPRTYGTPERENPGEYEYGQYSFCRVYV